MEKQTEVRMARHPIGVVSERTGLSPDVLRVWERRYVVVEPQRGEGGQRLYSDVDVERLQLLRHATQAGRGIGSVAALPMDELAKLVQEDQRARLERSDERSGSPEELDLDQALIFAKLLDADRMERLLTRAAIRMGAPRFIEHSAAPLLQRIGDDWHAGRLTIAQEHFATALVRSVVVSVLRSMGHQDDAPVILVSGPAGDRHEMGALLAAAVATSEGWRVVYLGTDLPAGEIAEAARAAKADAVGLSVVYVKDSAKTASELSHVRDLLPEGVPLLLGGGGVAQVATAIEHPGVYPVRDLTELRTTLQALANR